jgi:hypothetical protein
MRWYKTIPAITAFGATVSAATTAIVDPLAIPRKVHQAIAWLLPGRPRNWGMDLAADGMVGAIIALPGVIVAIALLLFLFDRSPGETRCRRCGHLLKGLITPRCPECREAI